MDMIEEFLQNGIESFLNNRFERANMYFSLVLSKDSANDIARFGVMCIDAIDDGILEAKDMFNIYIFSSDEQKQYIIEALESYQGNDVYDGAISNYIQELLGAQDSYGAYFNKKETFRTQHNDPDLYDPDFVLGKVYEKLGDYDKAIDYLAKAYALKPFDDNLKKELMQVVRKKNGKR
jgi:tetratricopeptide (TPR) repeat protein